MREAHPRASSADRPSSPRVAEIAAFAVRLPFAAGSYRMSHGRSQDSVTTTVVRVTTYDGVTGWGEACTLGSNYIEASAATTMAAVQELAPHVLAVDPMAPAALVKTMDEAMRGQTAGKSAVDGAFWDLRGKLLNQPVANLIGGQQQASYPIFHALTLSDPERMAEEADAKRREGYRHWQIKLGDEPDDDVRRTRSVLTVVEGDARFVTGDANGGWTMADALHFLHGVEGSFLFVEQPCRTLRETAEVRRRTSLPVIADEAIRDAYELIEGHRLGALDGVNIKPARVGGLTKACRLRDLAHELGLMVMIDESMGGGIATAAMGHLAASVDPGRLLAASHLSDFTDVEMLSGGGAINVAGQGHLSAGSGFGIEVDEGALGDAVFTLSA